MSTPADQARAELEALADRLKAWLHETSSETCYDLIAASETALRAAIAPPASPDVKVYDALSEVDHECT